MFISLITPFMGHLTPCVERLFHCKGRAAEKRNLIGIFTCFSRTIENIYIY